MNGRGLFTDPADLNGTRTSDTNQHESERHDRKPSATSPSPRPGIYRSSKDSDRGSSKQPEFGLERSWSFGRVVLAIVPATTRYMAAAFGAAAFSLQGSFVDEPTVIDSDIKSVYDFDGAPADSLSRDWGGELPAAVRHDTDTGQQLLETALTKTDQTSAEPTPYLYNEEGNSLASRDDLEAVTQTNVDEEKSYWVVPGVVERYTVTVPDGPKTQLSCECRSLTTPHVFTGRGGAPVSVPDIARPIWVCSACGQPTYGPELVDETNRDTTSETIPDPDGEPVKVSLPGGPAQEHARHITTYYDEYGLYPWEGGKDNTT